MGVADREYEWIFKHISSPSNADNFFAICCCLVRVGRAALFPLWLLSVEWGREGDPRLGGASETRMQKHDKNN